MEDALLEIAKVGAPVVTVTAMFVVYLWQRDRLSSKRDEMYNTTMNNHLDHLNDTLNKFNETLAKVGEKIDRCPNNK